MGNSFFMRFNFKYSNNLAAIQPTKSTFCLTKASVHARLRETKDFPSPAIATPITLPPSEVLDLI